MATTLTVSNHTGVTTCASYRHKPPLGWLAGRSESNIFTQTPRYDHDAIWREIKSLAEAEVASDSPSLIRPRFTIKQAGSTYQLMITKGDVGELGFGDDLYGIPFSKQILIEALRRALSEAHLECGVRQSGAKQKEASSSLIKGKPVKQKTTDSKGGEQWQLYLNQAEQLVKKAVADIETMTDNDRMKQSLRLTANQIDDLLYDKLYASIEQCAASSGHIVIYERGVESPRPFSVSVSSVPDGAKVWIITDLVYRKQQITKTAPSQWPWKEIVQTPVDLLGKYRYRAVWPDGRRAEGNIEVTNANPIKFTPQ